MEALSSASQPYSSSLTIAAARSRAADNAPSLQDASILPSTATIAAGQRGRRFHSSSWTSRKSVWLLSLTNPPKNTNDILCSSRHGHHHGHRIVDSGSANTTLQQRKPNTPAKSIFSSSTMTATIHTCSQTIVLQEKVPLRKLRHAISRNYTSRKSNKDAMTNDAGSIEGLSIVGRRLDRPMLQLLLGSGSSTGGGVGFGSTFNNLISPPRGAECLSGLQKLVLNGNQLLDKDWARYLQRLPPNVQEINLSWNSIGPKGANALATCLQDLREHRAKKSAAVAVTLTDSANNTSTTTTSTTSTVPLLDLLRLDGNPIGPLGIQALVQQERGQLLLSITNVHLWECQLRDEGAEIIGRALEDASYGAPHARTQCRIRHLNLDKNGIGHVGLTAIANGIKGPHSTLESLHLYCNHIQDSHIPVLMKALVARNKCSGSGGGGGGLTELSLCANRIGPVGAQCIASNLKRTSLERLHLSYNHIGDEGAQALAEALSGDYATRFGRDDNDVKGTTHQRSSNTTEQQEWFYGRPAQAPLPLKILTMSCNGLGNKSAVALADALGCKHAQNLQVLVMDGNSPQLDRRGAAAFVPCLQHYNKTLTELQILDDTHENHLLKEKLDMYVQFNKLGRQRMGDMTIPDGLWPCILGRQQQPLPPPQQQNPKLVPGRQRTKGLGYLDPQTPIVRLDHLYLFLRHRPDLVRSFRA